MTHETETRGPCARCREGRVMPGTPGSRASAGAGGAGRVVGKFDSLLLAAGVFELVEGER
jgi:hypothetical protein